MTTPLAWRVLCHPKLGYALLIAEPSSDSVGWNLVIWTSSDKLVRWTLPIYRTVSYENYFNQTAWLTTMIELAWDREME